MKLILGLGNIGQKYEHTRHNIGFMVLDHVAEEFDVPWHQKSKIKATMAEVGLGGQKIILAKPTTYYNLSGEAAAVIQSFYHIATHDILVVHDELALPFGTIRTRIGGSHAGNNGIKSLSAHIGEQYARIRLGTANAFTKDRAAEDFVLEQFSPDETETLPAIFQEATRFIEHFIHDDKEFLHTSVSV